MYTALYCVEFYNENSIVTEECGLIYADNFTEAMRRIEDYYGDDLEAVKNLELYGSPIFTFSSEMYPTIKQVLGDY